MKKTLVGGVYYGLHNIGDEAILSSIINAFRHDTEMTVMTQDPTWVRGKFPEVNCREIKLHYTKPKMGLYVDPRKKVFSNYMRVRKEIEFYSGFDYYLCGGATILSDCPWYSLRTVELADKAKVPTILWGVGMAEVTDNDTRKYIMSVLNRDYVKLIFTRDEKVLERLIGFGVEKDKLRVSYDPAIMIKGNAFPTEKYLTIEEDTILINGKMNIGVCLSGEADVVAKTPINVIATALQIIQDKYDANLIFIPTGCGDHCKDTEILTDIAEKIENENVVVVNKEFDPDDLVEFLKKFEVVISSRLHLNIFAANANVPSLGLVRNLKIIDFATLMRLPYLEFENLEVDRLVETVNEIIVRKDDIKNLMLNIRDMMIEKNKNAVLEAISLIEKGK